MKETTAANLQWLQDYFEMTGITNTNKKIQ
jgi:hypothetical protein